MELKTMEEKILCTLCKKEIEKDDDHWEWDYEDAHKKCVLDRVDTICSAGCSYFSIAGDDDTCRECGAPMRPLTKKDLEAYKSPL